MSCQRERSSTDSPLRTTPTITERSALRSAAALHHVADYVARIDSSPAFADEVKQRLAEKLAGTRGKMLSYAGRGPLGAWLRVAAVREAQSMARARKPTRSAEDLPLAVVANDPELALLKRRFAAAFRSALTQALERLDDEGRTVLRLYFVDALTYEELGRVLRVSRASAARRVTDARKRVVGSLEQTIHNELGADAPSAASLFALVESQLDVSVVRYFQGEEPAERGSGAKVKVRK
jgi:RNA polymerase sigma-70 factor (ECF subfamily)